MAATKSLCCQGMSGLTGWTLALEVKIDADLLINCLLGRRMADSLHTLKCIIFNLWCWKCIKSKGSRLSEVTCHWSQRWPWVCELLGSIICGSHVWRMWWIFGKLVPEWTPVLMWPFHDGMGCLLKKIGFKMVEQTQKTFWLGSQSSCSLLHSSFSETKFELGFKHH